MKALLEADAACINFFFSNDCVLINPVGVLSVNLVRTLFSKQV